MSICIIPAKGQSEGIPRKNFQRVGGISLIERTIKAAKESEYITDIFVSTESNEVKALAEKHGVGYVMEPKSNFPTSEACLKHALESIGKTAGTLTFLQCTSPFTTGAEIDACIQKQQRSDNDCVFTAVETHSGLWSRNYRGDLQCLNHDTFYPRKPRQVAEKCYRETGAVYVMDIARFLATGTRFCGKIDAFLVPELASVDIDNPYDLEVAKAVSDIFEREVDIELP